MISKTHIVTQKAHGRQLNAKVCSGESTISFINTYNGTSNIPYFKHRDIYHAKFKSCWHLINRKEATCCIKDNGWNQQSGGSDIQEEGKKSLDAPNKMTGVQTDDLRHKYVMSKYVLL